MAKSEKKNPGKAPGKVEPTAEAVVKKADVSDDEIVSEPVKLRPSFKDKLERIKKDARIKSVGDLIEMQMGVWVNQEYERIVLAEAEQIRVRREAK